MDFTYIQNKTGLLKHQSPLNGSVFKPVLSQKEKGNSQNHHLDFPQLGAIVE
ncbi:hypothetical protein B4077_4070 [Bacillus cereus]|uniref:Uncharacterized protein n=1 Tax=Bacillus cereus TaxID=1396 RepID=A0A0G8F337_BACCE|nr:hypothetical protein B4077_4070 [Bacillus cereus]